MPVRVTQSGIEVAREGDSEARITQSGIEVARAGDSALRITQAGIEVLSPNYSPAPARAWIVG